MTCPPPSRWRQQHRSLEALSERTESASTWANPNGSYTTQVNGGPIRVHRGDGWVDRPPPEGFDSWDAWSAHHGVAEEEWNDGAFLTDPDGVLPNISFLKVPEPKTAKNRVHLDVQAGGGRQVPPETRWPHVLDLVERLKTAGATVLSVDEVDGTPDHVSDVRPRGQRVLRALRLSARCRAARTTPGGARSGAPPRGPSSRGSR